MLYYKSVFSFDTFDKGCEHIKLDSEWALKGAIMSVYGRAKDNQTGRSAARPGLSAPFLMGILFLC